MRLDEKLRSIFRQLISPITAGKFAFVGVIGMAVETAVLVLAVEYGGVFPTLGSALGKEASIIAMFIVNNYWTFSEHRTEDTKELLQQLVKSHGVRVLGGGTALGILHILVVYFPVDIPYWYVIANAIGIGVAFGINYSLEHAFTWKTHETEE